MSLEPGHVDPPTPREEFEQQFGQITDQQWHWLKVFLKRNADVGDDVEIRIRPGRAAFDVPYRMSLDTEYIFRHINSSKEISMDSKDRSFFVNSNGTHGFFGGEKDAYCGVHGCRGESPECELKEEE